MTVVMAPGPASKGMPSGTTRPPPAAASPPVRGASGGPGPFSIQHLEGHLEQEGATRDLEGRDREAEPREDPLAEDREHAEGDRRGEAGLRDDVLFLNPLRSSVRKEKKGTTPSGSTIAKMEAVAVAPNARSAMVFLSRTISACASTSSNRHSRTRRGCGCSRFARIRPR